MADLQQFDPEDAQAIQQAYQSPNDPLSQQVIQRYNGLTTPQYTNDGQLLQPSHSVLPSLDVDTEKPQLNTAEKVAGNVGGFAHGVAESMNPLNIPHGVETLARLPFQDVNPDQGLWGRVKERFSKADAATVVPNVPIDVIAAGVRTAGNLADQIVHGSIPNKEDIKNTWNQQLQEQSNYNQQFGTAKTAGEITGAVFQGVQALKSIGSAAFDIGKQGAEKLAELRGLNKIGTAAGNMTADLPNIDLATPQLQEAAKLTKDLIPDLSPEIADAIFNRAQNVEKSLQGGKSSQELFSNVQQLRDHIDTTQDYLGDMVGGFRNLLRDNDTTILNTRDAVNKLGTVRNEMALTTGENTMRASDLNKLQYYQNLFKAPESKLITGTSAAKDVSTFERPVSDVAKILDHLDGDLKGFYQGKNPDNLSAPFIEQLANIRGSLKGELHEMYPAYGKLDELYSQYKNTSDVIRGKIDSLGGEQFLSSLFGQNKTEARQLFTDLVDQMKQGSQAVRDLSKETATGSRDLNNAANALVENYRAQAKGMKEIPDAQKFLNDVADKLAARKLSQSTNGGLSDFPADRLERLINEYVTGKQEAVRTTGAKIGGTLGGVSGGLIGTIKHGMEGTAIGGSGGAAFGSKVGGGLAQKLFGSTTKLTEQAKQYYDPVRLLQSIQEAKNVPAETAKFASDASFLGQQFGLETLNKFLNLPGNDARLRNALYYAGTSAGGFSQAIDENKPFQITPRPGFQGSKH